MKRRRIIDQIVDNMVNGLTVSRIRTSQPNQWQPENRPYLFRRNRRTNWNAVIKYRNTPVKPLFFQRGNEIQREKIQKNSACVFLKVEIVAKL